MQNRRVFFGAVIKLLILLGLLLLLLVFVNSLFAPNKAAENTKKAVSPMIKISVADMQKGQIIKARWNNQEVGVLRRQFPEKLLQQTPTEGEELAVSLDAKTRSLSAEYFVYFNHGDSGNCPLFYAAGIFKDVCSAKQFDESGRNINGNPQDYHLEIPPHYFDTKFDQAFDPNLDRTSLIIGKWERK